MIFNQECLDCIKNSKNVAIVSHVRPDADCLGSASALKSALIALNKNVDIFCDSEISENYLFLPHIKDINPSVKTYDLVVAVDCADMTRTGCYAHLFNHNNTLSIDHHLFGNSESFTKYLIKHDVSSTAEILFHFILALNVSINVDIAVALYAGIAADTGGFMHSNTTASVHEITANIMHLISNVDEINYYLFKRRTAGQIRLMKHARNNLTFLMDNRVAVTYLTDRDFKNSQTINSETFGIVDIITNIDNVEIGILISEKSPNLYACSLRGRNKNVSVIAEVFGGGGHKFASGCNIFGTHNTVIQKIEKAIIDNYDRIFEC